MKIVQPGKIEDSQFAGSLAPDSDGKIRGEYQIKGCRAIFSYSLTMQKETADYQLRGTVSLKNPDTGHVMQKHGQLKREINKRRLERGQIPYSGDHPDEGAARGSVRVKSLEPNAIKQAIHNVSMRLYDTFVLDLEDGSKKHQPVENMTFSYAVKLYADDYTYTRSKNAKSQRGHYLQLKKVGEMLGPLKISQISQNTIKDLCNQLGSTWRKYIVEARSFLNFIIAVKKESECDNKFFDYLNGHPTLVRKAAKNLQKKAVVTDILSMEEERQLNYSILENIEQSAYIGITLIKEGHLSATQACVLTWEQILFPPEAPDTVFVALRRDDTAGATHDYTFPLFPFGAQIIKKRYAFLMERLPESKVKKAPVVSDENDYLKAMAPQTLTTLCRNILQSTGNGYAKMAGLKGLEQSSGIQLLHNTYGYRLRVVCKLNSDPAIINFQEHRVLTNSVQADCYRSFTDASARYFLLTALQRDRRFKENRLRKRTISHKKENGQKQITLKPPMETKKSIVSVDATLNPGDKIWIRVPHGCKVSWWTD